MAPRGYAKPLRGDPRSCRSGLSQSSLVVAQDRNGVATLSLATAGERYRGRMNYDRVNSVDGTDVATAKIAPA
jgi:hypothetical protein